MKKIFLSSSSFRVLKLLCNFPLIFIILYIFVLGLLSLRLSSEFMVTVESRSWIDTSIQG